MEWNEKLQNIIDYVENHLQRKEEPINIDDIAKMAGRYYQKKISTRVLTVLTDSVIVWIEQMKIRFKVS